MRKNKEGKKGHETIIGKIIYGVLLFAPLLAILTTCCYVIFNKNAYKSYSGSASYVTTQNLFTYFSTSERTEVTEETINNVTHYKASNHNFSGEIDSINYNEYDYRNLTADAYTIMNVSNYTVNNQQKPNIKSIIISKQNSVNLIITEFEVAYNFTSLYVAQNGINNPAYFNEIGNVAYSKVDQTLLIANTAKQNINVTFVNSEQNIYYQIDNSNLKNFEKNIFVTDSTLSNVFYYSVDRITESPLFNWAKNTGMYQAVQTTCQGLGITNTFTPMLLTYWFMISIIYFIYDIGLMLIMIVHRKIHEVQESV